MACAGRRRRYSYEHRRTGRDLGTARWTLPAREETRSAKFLKYPHPKSGCGLLDPSGLECADEPVREVATVPDPSTIQFRPVEMVRS